MIEVLHLTTTKNQLTVFPMRSPAEMLILMRLPPNGYFLFRLGISAVSYQIKMQKSIAPYQSQKQTKTKKLYE
jgi:hypothetical protein